MVKIMALVVTFVIFVSKVDAGVFDPSADTESASYQPNPEQENSVNEAASFQQLYSFIQEIKFYPPSQSSFPGGTLLASFSVTGIGSIEHVEILKGVEQNLDLSLQRALRSYRINTAAKNAITPGNYLLPVTITLKEKASVPDSHLIVPDDYKSYKVLNSAVIFSYPSDSEKSIVTSPLIINITN